MLNQIPARAGAGALLLALLSSALPAPSAAQSAGAPRGPSVVAFVDVNVIPMDRERVLEHQTVVVRDGRIAQVGPASAVRAPADALVVDGRGKYLMPGVAEMHAHIPPPQAGEDVIRRTLFLYLSNGVTTVRGMLGHPHHLEMREMAERGEILSPRIYTSGPSLNGNTVKSPADARRMVEEQKAAGYDLLKLHPGLSRASYDAMVETAQRVGMPFAGHVPAEVGLERALEAKQASVDHLDGYAELLVPDGYTFAIEQAGLFGFNLAPQLTAEQIPAVAAATRAAGVWNVPTQSLVEHLASPEDPAAMARRPEMRYMPAATVAQWVKAKEDFHQQPSYSAEAARHYIDVRRQTIRALHDAGAGLLLGSDAPQIFNVPGFALQHELRYLVDSGLTPYEALETGTRSPAVYFDALDEFGTVTEGRAADLILLDANPLQDIAHFASRAGVMVRGHWMPQSEIQRGLEAIAAEVR